MRTLACIGTAALVVVGLFGCSNEGASTSAVTADLGYGDGYPLGWLGGRVHPVTSIVTVDDPDTGEPRVTGGVFVSDVQSTFPLDAAGAQVGDVIIRVGDAWIPNREDPTIDLYRLIESEVSAGLDTVRLTVVRSGAITSINIANDRQPLEIGGPDASERLAAAGLAGVDRLADWQTPDGTVGDLTDTALAGLAFIAGGRDEDADRLSLCETHLASALADPDQTFSAWDAAWTTLFLAERAGPLDIETTPIQMSIGSMPAGGLPEGFTLPDGASPPGGVVIGEPVMISSDGELPEGFEMPEGMPDLSELQASGSVQIISVGGPPPGAAPTATPAVATAEVDGPLWTPEQLAMLAGEDTVERLASLQLAVDRLVATQTADGGWDPTPTQHGFSDRTLATNQALMALGAAERAGVAVDNVVIRSGLAFLRSHTNDGHVFAVDAAGFDRRREAGRSSGAAAALRSLNCMDNDEFARELIDYSNDHGASVIESTSGLALHVFNTAVLRRQLGRGSWAAWFEDFRHLLIGMQDPDGTFGAMPLIDSTSPAAEFDLEDASRTALWSLCALMSADRLPITCAVAENPLQTAMDSTGARVAGGPPPGMPTDMQLDPSQILQMLEGTDLPDAIREAIENGEFEISTDGG